jgi:HEPN domain-containing protein
VEKYLKACLTEHDTAFPKTHDLTRLMDLLATTEPLLRFDRATLNTLTTYAVAFRYPGESATEAQARTAFGICKAIRLTIRTTLGIRNG